ncbi:hydroxyacid dehydrogenase [Paenibacillus sp. MY03]|uniref:phosphoglycerate dehydrogenase n=1 Tax=Paenibacillus sp. MY03 TaxID=302980 RepID=UPI000B3CFA0F|nr:phosphoglycerate dehydrogenase [Paenibacillus sp. MY03]OUS75520.1 hydroxyacid dehydrogenase [Paenibacillus sp. MY03]
MNKRKKVLVTPRSFGKNSMMPIEMLREHGFEIIANPYGRILSKAEMLQLIADVDGVIVGVDPLDRDVLASAPKLKAISKYGVGTDNIDLEYARQTGIPVTVTAGANTEAVADYTFALMLATARKVAYIDRQCRSNQWKTVTATDMYGKTLGLIGFGAIGQAVARRAAGFGMTIIAYDVYRNEELAQERGFRYCDTIRSLLEEADFISLHMPLNEKTARVINREAFGWMKPNAVIVNTARGGLIDEDALIEALGSGRIWGAGIDVFEQEPPNNPQLLQLDNLIISSHCAASTLNAVDNMGMMASQHIIDLLEVSGS